MEQAQQEEAARPSAVEAPPVAAPVLPVAAPEAGAAKPAAEAAPVDGRASSDPVDKSPHGNYVK